MGRLKIAGAGRLRAFEEYFQVEDPLGLGITLELWRRDARCHLEWLEKQSQADPVAVALAEGLLDGMFDVVEDAAAVKASAQAAAATVEAGGDQAKPDAAAAESVAPASADIDIEQVALVRRVLKSGKVSPIQLLRLKDRGRLEEAVALVRGWSGPGIVDLETGKPAEFTPENVRELLRSDSEVVEGEHEGKTLGEVLEPWVIDQASKRTRLARRVADAAAKACAPPSAS